MCDETFDTIDFQHWYITYNINIHQLIYTPPVSFPFLTCTDGRPFCITYVQFFFFNNNMPPANNFSSKYKYAYRPKASFAVKTCRLSVSQVSQSINQPTNENPCPSFVLFCFIPPAFFFRFVSVFLYSAWPCASRRERGPSSWASWAEGCPAKGVWRRLCAALDRSPWPPTRS